MEPLNYRIDVQNPFESAMKGYSVGAAMRNDAIQQQQMQQQAQQKAQMSADIGALSNKIKSGQATAKDFSAIQTSYPTLSEHFKRSWETYNPDQQKSKLSQATQVYAALQAGEPKIATDLLKKQAEAAKNAGNENESNDISTYAQLIDLHPEMAHMLSGIGISSVIGEDKFADILSKLGSEGRASEKAPSELSKSKAEAVTAQGTASEVPYKLSEAQSKAQKAAVESRFAESNAVKDLEKKGWDISKIQEDIKINKENAKIANLNAITNREANVIKRQENQLKLNEMMQKRDDIVNAKTAEIESARSNIDNMINTSDRILNTPIGVVGSASGPVSSRIPTTSQSTADFEALIETLGSQAFMAQIPNLKGMGALSNAEGEKLQSALQNFSLKQSPERLLANVREAQRIILKGRSNLAKKYGIPDSVPDTPNAAPSATDIDALLKKYGG